MKNLILSISVLLTFSCATLYPQLQPTCEQLCNWIYSVDSECLNPFTAVKNANICTLVCEEELGLFKELEYKKCLGSIEACEDIEQCVKTDKRR